MHAVRTLTRVLANSERKLLQATLRGSPGTLAMVKAVLVGLASVWLIGGCGNSKSNSSDLPGASCANEDAGYDRGAFEPSSIDYEFTSALNPDQLKLVAASIVQVEAHMEWLVAIQNNSTEMRCNLTARAYFLDAMMQEIGVVGDVPVHGTMSRTDISPATPCVAPGQIGIGQAPILSGASTVSSLPELATITYGLISYHNPEAIQNAVSLENVRVSGCAVAGALHNAEAAAIARPTVYLYPLNGAGRPLNQVVAAGPMALEPGSAWEFNLSAELALGSYAIFGEYGQP